MMSVQDVARYFGLHKDTIYDLVKEYKLPHFEVGGRIFFLRDVLETWLMDHMTDWYMVARLSCRVAIAFLAFRKIVIMKTRETRKMTKLHYHKDKSFFMDWLVLNDMSTGEIALWHTLMNIGNRLGQKSVFNAPTSTVMRLTGLSKQGIINARKKLMERGFISFQKGRQNKAPVYEMIPIHQTIDHYCAFGSDEGLTQDLTQDLTPELTQDSTGDLTIHKVQN